MGLDCCLSWLHAPIFKSDQNGDQDLLTDSTSNKYPLLPLGRESSLFKPIQV